MELNNGGWVELFEPYRFFEAYRNYLQIDIGADNDEDMRNWKGWVESRVRYLILKVMVIPPLLNYYYYYFFIVIEVVTGEGGLWVLLFVCM